MTDLSGINSEELKKMIEESYSFSILPVEEQIKMIEKIKTESREKQELVYIPFFKKKNEEEDKIVKEREDSFSKLLERLKEADRYIKNLVIRQNEDKEKKLEQSKEEELLNQLNQL